MHIYTAAFIVRKLAAAVLSGAHQVRACSRETRTNQSHNTTLEQPKKIRYEDSTLNPPVLPDATQVAHHSPVKLTVISPAALIMHSFTFIATGANKQAPAAEMTSTNQRTWERQQAETSTPLTLLHEAGSAVSRHQCATHYLHYLESTIQAGGWPLSCGSFPTDMQNLAPQYHYTP
jgi:hypothetical protein